MVPPERSQKLIEHSTFNWSNARPQYRTFSSGLKGLIKALMMGYSAKVVFEVSKYL
jgi:hypothetical protein